MSATSISPFQGYSHPITLGLLQFCWFNIRTRISKYEVPLNLVLRALFCLGQYHERALWLSPTWKSSFAGLSSFHSQSWVGHIQNWILCACRVLEMWAFTAMCLTFCFIIIIVKSGDELRRPVPSVVLVPCWVKFQLSTTVERRLKTCNSAG